MELYYKAKAEFNINKNNQTILDYDYYKKTLLRKQNSLKLKLSNEKKNKITKNSCETVNSISKLPNKIDNSNEKYTDLDDLIFVEKFSPGGATIVHSYEEDLVNFTPEKKLEFSKQFFKEVFREDVNGVANHVMGVLHNGAQNLPDFLEFLSDVYPLMIIKSQVLGKPEVETMTISSFYEDVIRTYNSGTYQTGGLASISLVGAKSEECGGYFSDLLDHLEEHPCIGSAMPWGSQSHNPGWPRHLSNDGPILWSRPGEQVIPTDHMSKMPTSNKKNKNELKNLAYVVRNSDTRETLIEDRTKAHADHVGEGLEKVPTAAVGILKAVHCSQKSEHNRVVKEAILFDAQNFDYLVSRLKLDLHEPPMTQCIKWIDDGKLNLLAREGVRYAKFQLRDNDVYFIPRHVVHQFKTITAVTSVAWHIRLNQYYSIDNKNETNTFDIIKHRDFEHKSNNKSLKTEPIVDNLSHKSESLPKEKIAISSKKKSFNRIKIKKSNKSCVKLVKNAKTNIQVIPTTENDIVKSKVEVKKPRKRKLDGFEVIEFKLNDMRFKTRVFIPKTVV